MATNNEEIHPPKNFKELTQVSPSNVSHVLRNNVTRRYYIAVYTKPIQTNKNIWIKGRFIQVSISPTSLTTMEMLIRYKDIKHYESISLMFIDRILTAIAAGGLTQKEREILNYLGYGKTNPTPDRGEF